MLYSIVGILVIILDQLVKYWVDKNISFSGETLELIPRVLSLVRVQNDGAAFSFLSGGGARIWFILLTFVFAILVVIALVTNFISGRFGRWCLVFITAGGLSNMIDRVIYGYVIDMFKVELFDFAVFNVADIFITIFCIAFILYILFGGEKEREGEADEYEEDDFDDISEPARQRKQARSRRLAEEEELEERAPVRRQPSPEKRRAAAVSAASVEAAARAQRSRPNQPKGDAETRPVRPVQRRPVSDKAAAEQNEADLQRMKAVREKREAASVQAQRRAAAARTENAARANDAMFDEMFATRQPAQRKSAPVNAAPAAPAVKKNEEDPFADWEIANAKAKKESPAAAYEKAARNPGRAEKKISAETQDAYSDFIAAATKPAKKAAEKPARAVKAAENAAADVAASAKAVEKKAVQPVKNVAEKAEKAVAAAPVKAPAKPADSFSSDDFDLDSILDEFR